MRKNIIILLSLLLMVFSLSPVALADQPPVTLDAAIAGANAELQQLYGLTNYFTNTNVNGKSINPDRWLEKNRVLFAYGDPYGDTKMTDEGIRYRYIGQTANGEDFTNPQFPHDAWAGGQLEDRTWYQYPWNNDTIKNKYGIRPNSFNGNDMYLPSIQTGLKQYYGDVLKGESSTYWSNWQEYVHILQPPTQYAWGLGRMWHEDSEGKLWYISIPLVPLAGVITTIPTPDPQQPQQPTTGYTVDGCFLDVPKLEGSEFSTYVIRAPRTIEQNAHLYDISTPIKAQVRVYLVGPVDKTAILHECDLPPENLRKLIYDGEITFTRDNPVWVQKFTFPIPSEDKGYSLFVQTQGGANSEIASNHGVSCSIYHVTVPDNMKLVGSPYLPGSHTTSEAKNFTYWLPWELINSQYGISPPIN